MLIEFLVDWRRHKAGEVFPWRHDGSAKVLIRRGKARAAEPPEEEAPTNPVVRRQKRKATSDGN